MSIDSNIRRYGEQGVRSSTTDPAKPCIGIAVIGSAVLKVPVVSSVREVALEVVRGDCIPTPAGDGDTQVLDVACRRREVDTVDVWVDGLANLLDNAVTYQLQYLVNGLTENSMFTFHIARRAGQC